MIKDFLEFWKDGFFKFSMFVFVLFGLLSICIMPLLLKQPAFDEFFNLSKGKDVADALNGLTSPFIALFASLLTFLAFYVQFKANIQQREQFKKTLENQKNDQKEQERIWMAEQFESRFFELLRLHKDNVNEIQVNEKEKGREAFYKMFNGLELINQEANKILFKKLANEGDYEYKKMDKVLVSKICYHLFFYGITGQEHQNLLSYVEDDYSVLIGDLVRSFKNDARLYSFKDGHSRWLDHYFRHLFITAKYVIEQKDLPDDETNNNTHDEEESKIRLKRRYERENDLEDKKKRYIKTLRAQLSNHEQLLLYYNGVLWYPQEWHELFVKYKIIKNLPVSLATLDPKPMEYFQVEIEELFKNGAVLFESQEKMEQKMYFKTNITE
jgi:hypothetical protein